MTTEKNWKHCYELARFVGGGKYPRWTIDGKRVSEDTYNRLYLSAKRKDTSYTSEARQSGPNAHGTTRWRHAISVYI